MIDRRTFVASGIAGLAHPAPARSEPASVRLYNRAIIIDGNLVPPITSLGPLYEGTAANGNEARAFERLELGRIAALTTQLNERPLSSIGPRKRPVRSPPLYNIAAA